MAPSSLMRWGVVAATAGCVLFSLVDPAVVGTFSGQPALRTLGTVALSAGLMVFLAGFIGMGSLAGLDRDRRIVTLASIALGSFCLLTLPVYHLIFTDICASWRSTCARPALSTT
jgi:ABC-type glucose/galactose transport system permease subunit